MMVAMMVMVAVPVGTGGKLSRGHSGASRRRRSHRNGCCGYRYHQRKNQTQTNFSDLHSTSSLLET
jgi:hypothetical protein